jgi:transposase
MINHRHTLVSERVRVKNNLRAMLRTQGLDAPKGLWKSKGLAWLENVEMPSEMDALQRDLLLQRLRSLTDMITRARTHWIECRARILA